MKKYLKQILQEEMKVFKEEILQTIKQDRELSRYLTRKQVAQLMSIGLSTVDYWARLGKLTKLRIHGTIRFDREQINKTFNLKSQNYEKN